MITKKVIAADCNLLLPQTAIKQKASVIIVGESPVDSMPYELMSKQFGCIAGHLPWDMLFLKSYYANVEDEPAKDVNVEDEPAKDAKRCQCAESA